MIKVVLIDDEEEILLGLKQIIDWQSLGFSVVAVHTNPIKAIEGIKLELPGVIISDIKMPGISGLELIRNLSKTYPTIKFVIISGYDSFEFAKKAIEYGVKNYLLKPIDENELIRTLLRIKKELSDGQQPSLDLQNQSFKSNLFIKLIQGILYDMNSMEKALLKTLKNNITCQVAVLIPDSTFLKNNLSQNLPDMIIREYVPSFSKFEEYYYTIYQQFLVCVILNDRIENANSLITKKTIHRFSLGYTLPITDMSDINSWVCTVSSALKKATFFQGSGLFLLYSYKPFTFTNSQFDSEMNEYINNCRKKIRESIFSLNPYDIELVFNELCVYIRQRQLDLTIDMVYTIYNNLINFTKELMLSNLKIESCKVLPLAHFETQISSIYSLESLNNMSSNAIKETINIVVSSASSSSKIIKLIESYIYLNCSSDLSLEKLAQKFFINPSYLSHLFSKETGITFIKFLTNIRLEKMKKLLLQTDKSIDEICKEVGFNSSKTMYKIFKETCKLSPGDFRKNGARTFKSSIS